MLGKTPKSVHFDIRRIDISKIPKSSTEIANWINNLWLAKEQKLSNFYSMPLGTRYFDTGENGFLWDEKDEPLQKCVMLFSFWFWMFVVIFWFYHLTFLRFVQVGIIFYFIVIMITSFGYGGIDRMVLYRWNKYRYAKQRQSH